MQFKKIYFIMVTYALKCLLVIAASLVNDGKPHIIEQPKDTETMDGGSTFFNCSTSLSTSEIHWLHYTVGSDLGGALIYGYGQLYPPYQGRFLVEKNEAAGTYNLVIPDAQVGDAGRYECRDDAGRGEKVSAQLIVLEESFLCGSNIRPQGIIDPNSCGIEPEELEFSCVVNYTGSQPPIMEWRKAGSDGHISEGVSHNVSSNRVFYHMTQQSSSITDGSSFQCQTTRSATAQHGCNSDAVKVIGCTPAKTNVIAISILAILLTIAMIVILRCGCVLRRYKRRQKESKNIPQSQFRSKKTEQMELSEKQDKEAMEKLNKENERLMAKVKELEHLVYSADNKRYRTASKLVHTIVTKAAETGNTSITGIAILDNDLFVVSKNYPKVEVYDSKTFVFERFFENMPLKNPQDIASSKEEKCLYIINRRDNKSESEIIKFPIAGEEGKYWVTENDDGRLSTYESKLIACFSTKRIIHEYSSEGKIENTVRLSPGTGFNYLWHAIKLTETKFAVSHSKLDDRQRVCVVDINGSVSMAFEELPTFMFKMNVPLCLVEDRDKSVFVADTSNNRVLLLSSSLKFEGVLVETYGNEIPVRLCLNDTEERVFVGVNHGQYKPETWSDGSILIYNITK